MKALKYSDICLIPNYSEVHSRVDCDPSIELCSRKFMLPIIPANMKSVIDMDLSRALSNDGYFYIMHRFGDTLKDTVIQMNKEEWPLISVSMGVKMSDKKDILALAELKQRIDFITIDIAHGHCERMRIAISWVKKHFPETNVIAGNVATPEAVGQLYDWGADVVKVGIGQGSPCTTKDKTGFTMPMFTCVQNCSNVMGDEYFVPIIADGGIKCNGDIAKAIVAGATMVMAGGLFAACTDSPAIESSINNVSHKAYFGSASAENKGHNNNIEGKLTNISCNNMTVGQKLSEITQDLQSSISYAGGHQIYALNQVQYYEV